MAAYIFMTKSGNHTIEAKNKKEAIEMTKEYAEQLNITNYLIMNSRADVVCAVYDEE